MAGRMCGLGGIRLRNSTILVSRAQGDDGGHTDLYGPEPPYYSC